VDDCIKYKVDSILSKYPHIKNIVERREDILYKLKRDQYSGNTLETDKEHTLANVLLNSNNSQYSDQLAQLDEWLCEYPKYATEEFGENLLNDFFSYYSEIEVYHHLKKAGFDPERDVSIGSGNKNLDFEINLNGKDFLIEVKTPRESENFGYESDNMQAEWGNPESGIHIKKGNRKIRLEYVIENKIKQQLNYIRDPSTLIILVINCSYAYPEIDYGDLSFKIKNLPKYLYGILLYRSVLQKNSRFYPNPNLKLSKEEINFFNGLMEN